MESVLAWLRAHAVVATWLAIGSTLLLLVGLVAVPIVLARLPADHFLKPPSPAVERHPLLRWTVLSLKNALGAVLVLAGLAMLLLPGQGILTLLVGLTLLDLPGKRRLELRLLRLRPVHRAINWVRAKAKQGPLLLPEEDG
jgi:hypothetical protein